jgi:hypothetical protein
VVCAVPQTDQAGGTRDFLELGCSIFLLGLEGQAAFEKAVQLVRQLPENLGPESVTLSRTGEWVIGYSQPPAIS